MVSSKELIEHLLSYNYINKLMNKFEEKDTQVGRTCAEILLAMIKFIIKNENDDEEDDTDDIEDETQIPEHLLYGNETKKEKMELDLNPFYKAFA
jgi:hypothetical protein